MSWKGQRVFSRAYQQVVIIGMFADNLVSLGFLSVCYIKSIPTHEKKKKMLWEKMVAQMPLLTYFLFGLSLSWVGGFVCFVILLFLICFPTQDNLLRIANTLNNINL